MTNPFPSGSSYSTSRQPNLNNIRRSSYASVAAGIASSAAHAQNHPPAVIGDISQLLRNEHTSEQRERDRLPGFSPNFFAATDMPSTKPGVESSWPLMPHSDASMLDDIIPSAPNFVCPSYLRESRYVRRLEDEHRAAITAAKERQRQGKQHPHSKDNPSGLMSTSSSGVNLPKLSSSSSTKTLLNEVIERIPPAKSDDDSLKKLPSSWSESDKCPGLELLNQGTEARFQGQTKTSDEAAAIRSDHPIPRDVGLYYFEVTILSRGKEGLIGIGFSTSKASLHRPPGWEQESWAYHGDDGYSFACTASGKPYGPKYSSRDVIGCGINFKTASAFFTKNGLYLGEAFHNIKADKLYPSVGMKKPGEHLRINFGALPFVFDIDTMMKTERRSIGEEINRTSATSLEASLEEASLIQELIAQYLAHDGYVETACAFADEVHTQRESLSGSSQPLKMFDPSQDIHAVNRQKIRAAILEGDIDKSLKHINTYYPHVLERPENRDVYFKLRCRKFIEMMRRSNELQVANHNVMTKAYGKRPEKDGLSREAPDHQMELDDQLLCESRPPTIPPVAVLEPLDPHMLDGHGVSDSADGFQNHPGARRQQHDAHFNQQAVLNEAIAYGRELNAEFGHDLRPTIKQMLRDIFALIAYTDAWRSSMSGLMDSKGRVEISEEVNAAILVSLGKPPSAALEKMCSQTDVLIEMLGAGGGAGAFVSKDYFTTTG